MKIKINKTFLACHLTQCLFCQYLFSQYHFEGVCLVYICPFSVCPLSVCLVTCLSALCLSSVFVRLVFLGSVFVRLVFLGSVFVRLVSIGSVFVRSVVVRSVFACSVFIGSVFVRSVFVWSDVCPEGGVLSLTVFVCRDRNLGADVTRFVPSALRIKRDDKNRKDKKQTGETNCSRLTSYPDFIPQFITICHVIRLHLFSNMKSLFGAAVTK